MIADVQMVERQPVAVGVVAELCPIAAVVAVEAAGPGSRPIRVECQVLKERESSVDTVQLI